MASENKENQDQSNEKMETSDNETEQPTIEKRDDLTVYFEKRDHSVNQLHQSEVPQICKDEPCQLGVDEAGRGPVLGPMVYGIAYAPLSEKQLLVDMGCADSKSLTEEKRDAIFDKICDNRNKMGWAIDAISPNYIANCMYRRTKTSLNEVSMNSAINLIRKTIEAGVFIAEIYVDTVGPAEKYQAKLEGIFPGIKIKVAKKADSTYPIVSAASICAKVSRDHALRAWQFKDTDNESSYGSGYPNDPLTKTWLADNVDEIFGFPQLVRFSWSTAEKILSSKAVEVEWEDPEEDGSSTDTKIYQYFSAGPTKKKETEKKRHEFFSQRLLSSATTL
ncbi:ribonuclease H2 subunit A [Copidosoma floridanum]|uniref:ribonuclease H2 subunit A n=1 Tax=Copidosoma floridanum TaxID=29053 RepID=UPI0006C9751D|nr:ribonuclease H2 subunit A [Copidosoma floridanum]